MQSDTNLPMEGGDISTRLKDWGQHVKEISPKYQQIELKPLKNSASLVEKCLILQIFGESTRQDYNVNPNNISKNQKKIGNKRKKYRK